MKNLLLLFFIVCLQVAHAQSTLGPDHSYVVRGYVLDVNQNSIKDLSVQVFAENELLGSSQTDDDGYYRLQLHLHNEDLNRKLRLVAGRYRAELRVTFDPKDVRSPRIHEANLVAGKLVESTISRFRIPSWSYALVGLILLIVIAVVLEKRRKKKIRLAKYGSGEKPGSSSRRTKKSRRRKH